MNQYSQFIALIRYARWRPDEGRKRYKGSLIPKVTRRNCLHRVYAYDTSWCLTIRGPWSDNWKEYNESTGEFITLTHGRKVVDL